MIINIDDKSGFCNGVVTAIKKAEEELQNEAEIFSLGDIMHNKVEMARLESLGLRTVTKDNIPSLKGKIVFIRAHGEPPSTYALAQRSGVRVVDATCKVVASIQRIVVRAYEQMSSINGQVVILGKKGHPEVIGLAGQIEDKAIIVENSADLIDNVDFGRPIYFLSQTTKSLEQFEELKNIILSQTKERGNNNVFIKDTICRQVAGRYPHLRAFAANYDIILFVSGAESSNGQVLYENCLTANKNSYKIENSSQIEWSKLEGVLRIGICGATSTPRWLMEQVKRDIENYIATK